MMSFFLQYLSRLFSFIFHPLLFSHFRSRLFIYLSCTLHKLIIQRLLPSSHSSFPVFSPSILHYFSTPPSPPSLPLFLLSFRSTLRAVLSSVTAVGFSSSITLMHSLSDFVAFLSEGESLTKLTILRERRRTAVIHETSSAIQLPIHTSTRARTHLHLDTHSRTHTHAHTHSHLLTNPSIHIQSTNSIDRLTHRSIHRPTHSPINPPIDL